MIERDNGGSMNILRYAARAADCTVLGPGKRGVVWVYGCCFSCEGCIAPSYKSGRWKEAAAQEMAEWFLAQNTDGLTISGGEPMLQAAVLSDIVERIRRERDCGVIVYTGFVYEDLLSRAEKDEGIGRFLKQIDLLIDGPYIQSLDHNQPYRGSENQRLIPLTRRYEQELENYYAAEQSRQIDIRISEQHTMMLGVPSREQAEIWRKIKELGERT